MDKVIEGNKWKTYSELIQIIAENVNGLKEKAKQINDEGSKAQFAAAVKKLDLRVSYKDGNDVFIDSVVRNGGAL